MEYGDFLRDFLGGLSQCLSWVRNFFSYSPILSDYLVFTIMAIAIFIFVVEELLGILTSLRFGGFFVRRFRHWFIAPIGSYETDYSKSFDNNYDNLRNPRSFRKARYYVSYNGKMYPVYSTKAMKKYARAGFELYHHGYGNSYNRFTSAGISGGSSSNYNSGGENGYNVSAIRGKAVSGLIKDAVPRKHHVPVFHNERYYDYSKTTYVEGSDSHVPTEAERQSGLIDAERDRIDSLLGSGDSSSKNIDIVKDDDE